MKKQSLTPQAAVEHLITLHHNATHALRSCLDAYFSNRSATYDELTKPLLDYYEKSGRLEKVSGEGDLEEIYQAIEKII